MRRPILNHLRRGELVYDPFLGSGTTLALDQGEFVTIPALHLSRGVSDQGY
jgi:hypothetical protein